MVTREITEMHCLTSVQQIPEARTGSDEGFVDTSSHQQCAKFIFVISAFSVGSVGDATNVLVHRCCGR